MTAIAEKKPTYKIFVLSDDEFEGLHEDIPEVSKENLKEAMGFANPKTKEAYVRRTCNKAWTDEVILHEAQELLLKSSPHEEDGIRYKKFFKDVFMPYIAPLAVGALTGGVGSALGLGATAAKVAGGIAGAGTAGAVRGGKPKEWLPAAALGGISGYGGATAVPGFKAGFAGAPTGAGILGKVGAGIKGVFTGAPKVTPTPTPTGTISPAQSLFGRVMGSLKTGADISAIPSTTGQTILGTTLTQLQRPPTTVGAPAVTPGITPPTAAPGITPPAAAPGVVTPAPTGLGAIAKRLITPEGLLGAGVLGAAAIPKAPEFEMPARIAELEEAFLTQRGLSEVGQVARGELLKTLQARPEELYPVADDAFIQASLRGTREAYDRAAEQLDAQYNIAGVYGSGEHLAAKDKLREELAQLESDFIALENNRRFTLAQSQKQQAVVTALQDAGLTEANIMELASLDVQVAAMRYGSSVEDIRTIQEALAGIGTELLTGAFKPTGGTTIE